MDEAWQAFSRDFVFIQGNSPKTIKHYTTAYNSMHVYIYILEHLNTEHISTWIEQLKKQGLADTTINLYTNSISSFCKWLFRKKLIPDNPFEGFKRRRPEVPAPKALKWTEAKTAIENCYGKHLSQRDAAFLDFLLYTGARSSEATTLTLDKLNLEDYSVSFEKTKGKETRIVYLGKDYLHRLNEYLQWRNGLWPRSEYVFPSKNGGEMNSKAAQKIPKRYGIPYHLHQFRHTYATEVLRKTGNLRLVQLLLGHKNIATTTRYLQVWDEDKMAAAKALDNIEEIQKVNKRGKRI